MIKPERPSTMKDIAREVGVSVTTVSHALNGTRHVEESTRKSILKAAASMGYKPNYLARSLKGKGSRIIGVIISDISESFFSEIVKSIEKKASEKGYSIILCDSEGNADKEDFAVNLLQQRGADGLIIAPVDQYKEFHPEKPVVQMDRKIIRSSLPFVGISNRISAERATALLIANGCRKIGFAGYGEAFYTMTERFKGYTDALKTENLKPLVFRTEHRAESADQIASWLEENRPDGVLCTNENFSYLTCLAAAQAGMSIPGDLKIAGFDDARWLSMLHCPLTVVRQPTADIGSESVELLINRIESETEDNTEDLILPCEIAVRRSCGSREDQIIKL